MNKTKRKKKLVLLIIFIIKIIYNLKFLNINFIYIKYFQYNSLNYIDNKYIYIFNLY